MPMEVLLGKPPKMQRDVTRVGEPPLDLTGVPLEGGGLRVLRLPTVARQASSITIGDRTVGGLSTATRWSAPGRCRWPTVR